MSTDWVIRQPDTPSHLVLLFHGVGASADDLAPLGEALAHALPRAWIVSLQAPERMGPGWQWFSVAGIRDEDRPARVAEAMPGFVTRVRAWQAASRLSAQATTLLGFSQGGIMALESTQLEPALAGRVFALSSRFASPPRIASPHTRIHLLHGQADPVMPVMHAEQAEQGLRALGGSVTLDRFPGLGHGIDRRVVQALVHHLGHAALELESGHRV